MKTKTSNSSELLSPSFVIRKKRDGKKLSKSEINYFIEGLSSGDIPDYQMSALLMAIYLNGFDSEETTALTNAMLNSGEILSFNDPTIVDKHSTGGIGDKATFILAPMAAACGVKVPSIAGRGLSFTGGTVDKIEAIKGFNTSLDLEKFQKLLRENGLVLIGQTGELAPADKKIYALRDVTATVSSIPLITASIMSKKLSSGISGIVLDVKTGPGAFMKSKKDSKALAKSLVNIANKFNKKCMAFISDMSQPLGYAVGNTLEMIESIETLKNNGPKDLTELSVQLAGAMIYLAGQAKTKTAGIKKAKKALTSGEALKKFRQMIEAQGGDTKVIDDYSLMQIAQKTEEVLSPKTGYIKAFQNDQIGLLCTELGGGRKIVTDQIDHGVGFVFHKKIGEKVKKGESLLTIYYNEGQEEILSSVINKLTKDVIKFTQTKLKKPDLISDCIEQKAKK